MSINLIFLFSLPRSGSTLLQKLIASHKQVYSTTECWFLLPVLHMLKHKGTFTVYGSADSYKAIQDFIRELPNGEEDFYGAIREFAYGLYSKATPKSTMYFLDKTPRYYLTIAEIAKVFPDAKFIFLLRNPLAVMSSVIHTWNKGRLRLHYNYMDLIKGPQFLSEGLVLLKNRAISVQYEELVMNPESNLKRILDYLELEFDAKMLFDHFDVGLEGRMGDKSKRHGMENSAIRKWKATFNTTYRKSYAKNYLDTIGSETLTRLGYDIDHLKIELDQIVTKGSFGIKDRSDVIVGKFMRIFEVAIMMRKVGAWKAKGRTFFMHY